MVETERFRINRPDVIHEILDGELVIVNLRSGAYYSLDGVGAVVWREIERGASATEIVTDALARFDGEPGHIDATLRGLLAELVREQLVKAANGSPASETPAPAASVRAPFAPPRLQKYTDMQDLLLLDPIHEVDEGGWPTRGA